MFLILDLVVLCVRVTEVASTMCVWGKAKVLVLIRKAIELEECWWGERQGTGSDERDIAYSDWTRV